MDILLSGGGESGLVESKTEGYFKMQIGSDLNLFSINQDAPIDHEDVLREVKIISARVELKDERERSPLPSHPTVYKLARWFRDNQRSSIAPSKPS
jgi:hypothetical protein